MAELALDGWGNLRHVEKMKQVVIALGVGVVLSGCIQQARMREVVEAVEAAKASCRAQTFKTRVENAQCINDAERRFASVYPNPDLLNLRLASRMAIAERQDRGLLSPAEAELEFAKISAEIGTQETSRQTGRQIANAQSQAAAAASEIARPKTCYTYMGTTTCY